MSDEPMVPVHVPSFEALQALVAPRSSSAESAVLKPAPAKATTPSGSATSFPTPPKPGLSPLAEAFVRHAALYGKADLSLEERWRALGVNSGSVKRGVLKELREQGLIRLETKGRQKTVYLYRRAYDLLGLKAPTGEGVGGAAHKALVCRMAAVFKRRGYEVHIEQEIGLERKRADLVCYGKGYIIGIEMGLSDVRQELRNLRADLAAGILDLLLFVTTDRELLRQVRTRASEDAELAPQLRRLRFLYFPEEDGS